MLPPVNRNAGLGEVERLSCRMLGSGHPVARYRGEQINDSSNENGKIESHRVGSRCRKVKSHCGKEEDKTVHTPSLYETKQRSLRPS
ncbi:hypothetical protein E2542_SST09357 [Spatholobus suberectus]|nr:hypothetical protein E2542_SST09357 [Spatholobus suberectus]